MFRNKVYLELAKNERVYRMECDNQAPAEDLRDVLNSMLFYVNQLIQQSVEKQAEENKKQDEMKEPE